MSNTPSVTSDPVTAVFSALTALLTGVASPLIAESLAQRYENQFKSRCDQYREILAVKDDNRRADLLSAFVVELCGVAGTPAGDIPDNNGAVVPIPVSHLTSLVTIAAGKIKADQNLAALTATLSKAV